MDRNEAVAWVDRYMCLVEKEIRKFMNSTPYDKEDFLHDAYEAALLAIGVSSNKGISFSTAFWHIFGKTPFWASPSNTAKRRIGVSLSVFAALAYSDDVFYGGEAYHPDPEDTLLSQETRQAEEKTFSLFVERLKPVEKKVINCICGLDCKRMSLAETAQFLGISKGSVYQSFRRIMKKALRFRMDRGSDARLRRRRNGNSVNRKLKSCHLPCIGIQTDAGPVRGR